MTTRRTTDRRSRGLLTATGLLGCLLAAGCGGAAVTSPDTDPPAGGGVVTGSGGSTSSGSTSSGGSPPDSAGDPGAGGSGDDSPGRAEYKWGLPPDPGLPGPGTAEGDLYPKLAGCADVRDEVRSRWSEFASPRDVLLYMAAAQLCAGDAGAAGGYFGRATALGSDGLGADHPEACNVYRSAGSVLTQRPPDSFSCGGGDGPAWKENEETGDRDNPLTDDDESAPTTSAAPDPGDSPTEPAPTSAGSLRGGPSRQP
jgi:hypothetical protein